MSKGRILIYCLIILLFILGIFYARYSKNNTEKKLEENIVNNEVLQNEGIESNAVSNDEKSQNAKSLVLYFSATNNTEQIANYIKEITNSDIIEIKPKQEYTSEDLNYNNNNSRANKEQNDDLARPEIANTDLKFEEYEVIYLGYPIWWGKEPRIILTLLDNYNLEGKTIIPFCTSGSSGIETSVNNLRKYNSKLNVLNGKRFSSSASKTDVEKWINQY